MLCLQKANVDIACKRVSFKDTVLSSISNVDFILRLQHGEFVY